MKKLPIVAIVGRANVGKSSLFNAVLERRETIVAREAGTTRDSIWAKAGYQGQDFWLIDTAGIKSAEDDFEFTIQEQILQAADSADVIWVVIEADSIISDEDRKVARMALKSRKPVFLVVNKIDKKPKAMPEDYQRLGIKPILLTSMTQHRGVNELLDTLIENIPKVSQKDDDNRLRIALLGRPNVGKSQLFNTLAKKQQAVVADRAGTTRDINRAVVRYQEREIELMDTAGIRRNGKIEQGIEQFSVLRSIAAIEQSDVCVMLIDANDLMVALDQKIAGMIKEAGKGLILVISKWDSLESKLDDDEAGVVEAGGVVEGEVEGEAIEGQTASHEPAATPQAELTKAEKRRLVGKINVSDEGVIQKDPFTRDSIAAQIAHHYEFVPWAPLVFTSAVTGKNVTKLFDLALEIDKKRGQEYNTAELNRWLRMVVAKHPPAGLKNRLPKLNYMVHEAGNPVPSYKIFGAHTKFLHWSYKRYLEKEFRYANNLEGTPLKFWFIEKHETHKHGVSPTKERNKNIREREREAQLDT